MKSDPRGASTLTLAEPVNWKVRRKYSINPSEGVAVFATPVVFGVDPLTCAYPLPPMKVTVAPSRITVLIRQVLILGVSAEHAKV